MNLFKKLVNKTNKLFFKSLDYVEIVGNALPHPATIFFILSLLVILISYLAYALGFSALHPRDASIITPQNILNAEGFRWIYLNLISNFVNFPPLGMVLAVIIGTGLAEATGLISALIRALVLWAPSRLVTAALILAGILSHLATDAGYIILIPLGAMTFHALGRHPIAGLAATFAGVSGGYGANLMIGAIDPLLAGLTTSGARLLVPDITINPAVNLYFMIVSSIVLVIVGTIITEKIVEPRLGKYTGNAEKMEVKKLSSQEKKGILLAFISLFITFLILAYLVIPKDAILRNPVTGNILDSPFLKGLVVSILTLFFVPGLVYGITVGVIKNDKHVIKLIGSCMSAIGSYIVLVFFAAQFVALFGYSKLGVILAIKGAELLTAVNFTGPLLIIAFVFLCAIVNLFMGSASAKWSILAPIFVPMLMLMGYHPSLTQMAFRIGDSVTNIITPLMSYFPLIITFVHKYDEKSGVGTIISTMVPYSIVFTIVWSLLLFVWMYFGLPLGPDGPLFYTGN